MSLSELRRLFRRLAAHFGSARAEADLAREVEAHLRLLEDDYVAGGLSREEARYAARRAFGGVAQMQERQRDARGLTFLTGWRMDLRLAARMLVRHPALSVIAVFGITVAIAMATTLLTIIGEQLNPSPLPLPGGDRIVALQQWDAQANAAAPLGASDVLAWRQRLSAVKDIGAFRTVTKNLILSGSAPEPITIAELSAAGFTVTRGDAAMGRTIQREDERGGAAPVVVIGHAEWQSRFGGRADVLSTTVQLGATHHAIIGVMPEGFAFPVDHAYWIPLQLDPAADRRSAGTLSTFGRLADGATLETAQAEIAAVGGRLAQPADRPLRPRVTPYAFQFTEGGDPGNVFAMQLVRFFVTMLLGVISINVAVLVYARTAARHAEIAVRTALGASRGRIVAQLFAEGLVLAGLGAAAGVGIATIALAQVRATFAQEGTVPFWIRFDLSAGTIAFVVLLTLIAAAMVGALPAWRATGPRVQNRLQALSAGGGGGMHLGRVWTSLILLQVAFAVALLPMVLVRMSELASEGMSPLGFAADQFVVAQLSLETSGARTSPADAAREFARRYRDVEQRTTQSGTVNGITFAAFAPGFEPTTFVQGENGGGGTKVRMNRVSQSFFGTFGVPILAGRDFSTADAAAEGRAVIVNQAFANLAANGPAVIGARLRLADGAPGAQGLSGLTADWYEIVGIVQDFPASKADGVPEPRVYRAVREEATHPLTMALRLRAADTDVWGTRLREIAAGVDPLLQVKDVSSMGALLRQEQRTMRLLAGVFVGMTLSVLLLSAAGVYAMMSFAVTRRRREIGIRLALGAGARRILWTMFSRIGAQLLAGAALGSVVALVLNSATGGGLLKTHAPVAIGTVIALIGLAGLLAALGPARQGLRIPPTEALRDS